jgi:hypothetical protein
METKEMLDEGLATEVEPMVPKPLIGLRVPPEVKAALEKLAKADDRTISYVINKILREYLRAKKLIK